VQPIICCTGSSPSDNVSGNIVYSNGSQPANNDGYFTDPYLYNQFRGGNYPDYWLFKSDYARSGDFYRWFTTPHLSGMPCLFADGSVRNVSLAVSADVTVKLFAYNDGGLIPTLDP
jgi:prepilin-type processing-associated H-X9-DG protein